MKKIATLITMLVLVFGFSACGAKDATDEQPKNNQEITAENTSEEVSVDSADPKESNLDVALEELDLVE